MNHADHVSLLRNGIGATGGIWADLGAGTGAFTLALAELVQPDAVVYAVDRDSRSLRQLAQAMHVQFPAVTLHTLAADFTEPLPVPPLDGVVMANSLHFVRHKEPVLQLVRSYLKPGGRLLIVEYNTDHGNVWVPHPFSFSNWRQLAKRSGFARTELLATRPGRFLDGFYAAASFVDPQAPSAPLSDQHSYIEN
jgi:ubiquinone/menaquinone biosynthesis C-methylase UbiE